MIGEEAFAARILEQVLHPSADAEEERTEGPTTAPDEAVDPRKLSARVDDLLPVISKYKEYKRVLLGGASLGFPRKSKSL